MYYWFHFHQLSPSYMWEVMVEVGLRLGWGCVLVIGIWIFLKRYDLFDQGNVHLNGFSVIVSVIVSDSQNPNTHHPPHPTNLNLISTLLLHLHAWKWQVDGLTGLLFRYIKNEIFNISMVGTTLWGAIALFSRKWPFSRNWLFFKRYGLFDKENFKTVNDLHILGDKRHLCNVLLVPFSSGSTVIFVRSPWVHFTLSALYFEFVISW